MIRYLKVNRRAKYINLMMRVGGQTRLESCSYLRDLNIHKDSNNANTKPNKLKNRGTVKPAMTTSTLRRNLSRCIMDTKIKIIPATFNAIFLFT
jgi:hypothetical protein